MHQLGVVHDATYAAAVAVAGVAAAAAVVHVWVVHVVVLLGVQRRRSGTRAHGLGVLVEGQRRGRGSGGGRGTAAADELEWVVVGGAIADIPTGNDVAPAADASLPPHATCFAACEVSCVRIVSATTTTSTAADQAVDEVVKRVMPGRRCGASSDSRGVLFVVIHALEDDWSYALWSMLYALC